MRTPTLGGLLLTTWTDNKQKKLNMNILKKKKVGRGQHCGIVVLQSQHPTWAPVCVSAAALWIQLSANSLAKQRKMDWK